MKMLISILISIIIILIAQIYRLNIISETAVLKVQVFNKVLDLPNDYVVVVGGFSSNSEDIFLNGLDKRALIGKNTPKSDEYIKALPVIDESTRKCDFFYGLKNTNDGNIQAIYNKHEHIIFINEKEEIAKALIKNLCKGEAT